MAHDVGVAADGYVLVLHCTCGYREELADDELPVAEVVVRAEDHRWRETVNEDVLAHAGLGHFARLRPVGEGMALVCSCGSVWQGVPV